MSQFKDAHIDFNGDRPKDKRIAKIIEDSGFYRILYGKRLINEDGISITSDTIYTHGQKNVDSELTAKLIEENTPFLWGEPKRCQGVQRIFIELMQNTNNHASHTVGDKYWWLSMSKRENPNTLCFSFIDYGMGIFNSLKSKRPEDKFYGWMEKLRQVINTEKNCDVLRSMLSGQFHQTVTKKYYRGKGLPGIYNEVIKNSITKLTVISNDAYGNPITNDYRKMTYGLEGTFVHFEVDSTCRNCNA